MYRVLFLIFFCFLALLQANQVQGALVEVGVVKKGIINPLEEFSGSVYFLQSSDIASQSSGAIRKENIETGKFIKKGVSLVELDSDILDTSIKILKASLNIAKIELENIAKDLKRYETLVLTQTINQKLYDDTKFAYTIKENQIISIEAELEKLEIDKKYKNITAPFSGIIVDKKVGSIGEWVGIGTKIATIVNTDMIEIIFNLPSRLYGSIDLTKEYDLVLDNTKYKAKIFAIIPKGDMSSRTFMAKVKLDSSNLKAYEGMKAVIKIPNTSTKDAFLLSRDSVIIRFNQEVVFVNNNGFAQMIPVNVIGYQNDLVAVEGVGLTENMQVIIKGNERVFPNQPIVIK
ncbi:efflux RND transporter periplasmic adaptor subunit [Arcobacter sp. FWKO B]|uniref:efflux RND transporter periplasmic adaptor subunit n=1 Tax=Arcobacter sp. FWKO B TaxID=2593672 RepID=UPI0018A5DE98|nr:efflux RND transporter periplasmic adaptor subunit [Arcobacter sp. FWKO B]QOG11747.1 efflux RND transporter periplasmic adaptor subunit [Arcobacter sp. FWKO B]